jgi:hypothetical protein
MIATLCMRHQSAARLSHQAMVIGLATSTLQHFSFQDFLPDDFCRRLIILALPEPYLGSFRISMLSSAHKYVQSLERMISLHVDQLWNLISGAGSCMPAGTKLYSVIITFAALKKHKVVFAVVERAKKNLVHEWRILLLKIVIIS